MSASIQERIDQARKAYHDEMAAVRNYEQHEAQQLRTYETRAEKQLADDLKRRYSHLQSTADIAKRKAMDRHNEVSDAIMRNFKRSQYVPRHEKNKDFKEAYERTEWGYYYRVLGLAPGSSQTEVRNAYRVKARIYHPDRKFTANYSDQNQAYMWKVIQKAHEILGKEHNSKLKERYDKTGNADGWVHYVTDITDGVAGAFKNKCYNLGGSNPYRVIH